MRICPLSFGSEKKHPSVHFARGEVCPACTTCGDQPQRTKKKILNALKKGISSIQAELSDRPVRFYEVKGMIRQKNRDTATKRNKRKEKEAKEMFPTFPA